MSKCKCGKEPVFKNGKCCNCFGATPLETIISDMSFACEQADSCEACVWHGLCNGIDQTIGARFAPSHWSSEDIIEVAKELTDDRCNDRPRDTGKQD